MNRFWRDRPTFVTGATGLVGGWLVRRLLELEADVVCLVRDWNPKSELLSTELSEEVRLVRGDVRDLALLERSLAEYEIRTVLHLAAQTIVPIANSAPEVTLDTNVRGTWAILEACRRTSHVEQIIVASSDKAYGAHDELPYVEDMALVGRHPYDVSKSCADLIARTYAECYASPVVVTRFANFFGGGDLNWNRLIPGTIRSVLRGERPVIRSDGNFVRDLIYVEDGAQVYTMLAERLAEDRALAGESFNFSNEMQMNVLEMTGRILAAMGSALEPDVQGRATHEIRAQFLSCEKARRRLGWTPRFDLDEGLRRTIHWYQSFFGAA